jgi:hypothetical protein
MWKCNYLDEDDLRDEGLGRSPMRWTDLIRTTLETGIHDAIHVARDRDRWKTLLREIMKGGRDS